MPIKIRLQEVNLVTNFRFRYKANFYGLNLYHKIWLRELQKNLAKNQGANFFYTFLHIICQSKFVPMNYKGVWQEILEQIFYALK